jgi:molybdopterin molybdotransferase
MAGQKPRPPLRFTARLEGELRKKPGRRDHQRGILSADQDGLPRVTSVGAQGSHLITSFANANCLIILPEASSGANQGDLVLVEPMVDRL